MTTGMTGYRRTARSARFVAFGAAFAVSLGACGASTSPNTLVNIPTDVPHVQPVATPTPTPLAVEPTAIATSAPTTAKPAPKATPKLTPKPTKAPSFYKPPGWDGYSDVDCPDFDTHAHAQSFFIGTGGTTSYDPYRLDADHDGIACE
jgi:hypothetical protein